MEFTQFNFNDGIQRAIQQVCYIIPTEFQAKTIPILLENECDFVGQAQTGTGKTAAFVLPLLANLDPNKKHVQTLILSPTRELAQQIHLEIEKLGKFSKIKSTPIFGGGSYSMQMRSLKRGNIQIVVGTPGRVMDLMDRGVLKLENAHQIVLDEVEDVQQILTSFPESKRAWMFSATMPKPIRHLIEKEFKNPTFVQIKKQTLSNADIEQCYYLVKERNHREALCRILDASPDIYGLIFCRTRQDTMELSSHLLSKGHKIETLHGEMSQAQRDVAMNRFKTQSSSLMVCTDVAARGIDVNNLTHVINYGLPQDLEIYVHRIGRTGRAGMKGTAITLVDQKHFQRLKRTERLTKQPITLKRLPSVESLKITRINRELTKLSPIMEAVVEKGSEFEVDATFDIFESNFSGLSKDDLLKIMFTWGFKKHIKSYNNQGELDQKPREKRPPRRNSKRDLDKGTRNERNLRNRGVRLQLNMGHKDGLRLHSLLNTLSRQVGIHKHLIQNVNLGSDSSFLEVPKKVAQVIRKKRNLTLNKKPVRYDYA